MPEMAALCGCKVGMSISVSLSAVGGIKKGYSGVRDKDIEPFKLIC